MATRSDFYGDAVVSHYIDSLRRNVSSSPDYESWEYTESPYFNRQTDDWTTYPVRERIFAGVMSDPALAALYSKFYTAPGETVTSRDYYGTATKDQGDNSFLSDMADPLKFAAMSAGLGFGGNALFGGNGLFGGVSGGLLDTALPAELFGGNAAAGSAGGGMDFLSSLNSNPFGSGGSSWFENLSTPDWSGSVVDSVAPAASGWGSNVAASGGGASWLSSILNTPGAGSVLQSLLPSVAGTGLGGSALGGLLGALASSLGGSKQTGTQTSIQDIPDWQKPFVMSAMTGAANQYANTAPSSLLAPAEAQMGATINGAYLNPESNPYLRETYNQGAQALTDNYLSTVQPRTDAMFGRSGQAFGGNSGYQETVARNQFGLGQNLKNLATDVYGGNYNRERQNQFTATQNAPSFATNRVGAQFAPVNNFSNISNRSMGSQTSTPLYENKAGQALYGGLLGSQIFR